MSVWDDLKRLRAESRATSGMSTGALRPVKTQPETVFDRRETEQAEVSARTPILDAGVMLQYDPLTINPEDLAPLDRSLLGFGGPDMTQTHPHDEARRLGIFKPIDDQQWKRFRGEL